MIFSGFDCVVRRFTKISVLVLIVAGLPIFHSSAFGHHPHDMIDALAVSPAYHEDQTVFVAIASHFKKSENGGASWKTLIRGIGKEMPATSIALSDSFREDKTMFMGTDEGSIYKSTDRGLSWARVGDGSLKGGVSRIRMSPQFSRDGIVLVAGMEGGFIITRNGGRDWVDLFNSTTRIGDMAFAPGPGTGSLLVGDDSGRLHISKDSGRTWQELFYLPESGGITSIAVSPDFSGDGTIFLGTKERGVIKTTDGGKSFAQKNNHLTSKHIVSIGLSPTYKKDGIVFVSTWFEAIFKSHDNGETWVKHDMGLTTDRQADSPEYLSPHFREIVISSFFDKDQTVFLAGFDGLFKSTDGGTTWEELETLYVGLIKGMAVAVNETGNDVISLITYGGGASLSQNGGSSWTIRNQGLKETRLMDIVFSPSYKSDGIVYSASQGSLLKSVDGGVSWNQMILNEDLPLVDRIRRFLWVWARRGEKVFGVSDLISRNLSWNPHLGGRPYPTVVAFSPAYERDKTIFFGTRWHGVYKSTDGGANCINVARELGRVLSLSMSNGYITDRTVFANSLGRGVYKSEDDGKSWQEINKGLPSALIQEENNDMVSSWRSIGIMVSPFYTNDKTIFAGSSEGFFRSSNNGEQWIKTGRDPRIQEGHISGMGISPFFRVDRTLIVSVYGKGLFRSVDGGTTFAEIAPQLVKDNHVFDFIEFSPNYEQNHTIYGASEEHVFRSGDQGDTWEKLKHPVRYENHRDVVKYFGNWTIQENKDYSAGRVSLSNIPGDTVHLNFVGEGVNWIGKTGPDQGIARIFIDNVHQHDVDLYSEDAKSMVELYEASDLVYGPHSIRLEVGPGNNAMSSGTWVTLDAFDVN